MTTPKRRRAPKAKPKPRPRRVVKPALVVATPTPREDVTAPHALALAEAANSAGTAVNAYFQRVCLGDAPLDPRVLGAAHALRNQALRVIRHHEGSLPALDGENDLGAKLTRIADVLEQLADNPPSSWSLYRAAVIGLALSRIETMAMRILSSPVQGEG